MSHVSLQLTQLLIFQFSAVRQTILFRHSSRLDHETVHQTTTTDSQIRRPHPNTTKGNRHDPTTKSDHQIPSPPPIQTTRSDHPTRPQYTILDYSASNQDSIPNLWKGYRSGAFFMGWVKGGYIKLWMNLAKHTFHTRSA